MAKTKRKAVNVPVPQSQKEAGSQLGRIGDLRREIAGRKAAADAQVARIGEAVSDALAPVQEELGQLEKGLQIYCEANRQTLTNEGKRKHHDFGTGKVHWRLRPPSVTIRGLPEVIERIKSLKLMKFLRVKVEVDREAMLKDRKTASAIDGVTIKTDGEDFVIEPAEIEMDEVTK